MTKNARDEFPEAVKRIVAQRVAWRCSEPECRAITAGPHTLDSKALNVGVAAHITAAAPGGPRFDPALTEDERRSSTNAIWMCQTHGKLVDNDEYQFTVEMLRRWKADAEKAALIEIGRTAGPADDATRDELWELFKQYTPDVASELLFLEGYSALAAADPELRYDVSVGDRGVTLTVASRDGKPISASFDPHFPDTEEGQQKAAQFARFLTEGTAVDLDETNVDVDKLPEPIRRACKSRPGAFHLRIGPRRPRRFLLALRFENEQGNSYEFPYIDLATNRFEEEVVVLSNEQQPIAFKFEERLFPGGRTESSWRFDLKGKTFWSLREVLAFLKVMTSATRMVVKDLETGIELVGAVASSSSNALNEDIDASFVERVVDIQMKTQTPIPLPERAIVKGDLNRLALIEEIVATGTLHDAPDAFAITVNASAQTLVRGLAEGARPLEQTIPMHREELFGQEVPLGPVRVFCRRVIVHPEDASVLQKYLALPSDNSEAITIRLLPAPEASLLVQYLWWPKFDTR